jgi:hypothetical protein
VLRGTAHGRAKIIDDDVRQIRELHRTGALGTYQLGQRYGLAHKTIGDIVKRKLWAHVA